MRLLLEIRAHPKLTRQRPVIKLDSLIKEQITSEP